MDDKQLTINRADAMQRAMRGWSMRVAGFTWAEVAQELGYSDEANALRAVKNYFSALPQPSKEDARQLWRQRHEGLWKVAMTDAELRRPGALRSAVAVARSASQLDGLDAPQRIEVSAGEIDAVVARLFTLHEIEEPPTEADIFAVIDAEVIES